MLRLRHTFIAIAGIAAMTPITAMAAPSDLGDGQKLANSVMVPLVLERQEVHDLTVQLDTVTAQRDDATSKLDAANAQIATLQSQIETLQGQVAWLNGGAGAGPVAPRATGRLVAGAAGPNHFPWGWCTWYVASRRWVPWSGNAGTWLSGAASYGYAEGKMPRPGAIMVSADSAYGHVSYVESVGSGFWTVSEMNYYWFGVVDTRTVTFANGRVLGFIYG